MVVVPSLRVTMEPYFAITSSRYSKKGFPERAIWKRFPTIGHPGGPGGRFTFLDLFFCVRKNMRHDRRNAKAVKMRWLEEVKNGGEVREKRVVAIFGMRESGEWRS